MTILLAAVGAGVVILGAVVLILMPNRPGGTISWAGVQVNSAGAGLPLVVVGVATIAVAVSRAGGDDPPSGTTTEAKPPVFEDYFEAPSERRWNVVAGLAGTGARYEDGTFRVSARRVPGGGTVFASPRLTPQTGRVRLVVKARRTGGTAQEGFGYGLYCRGDGPEEMYLFTVFAQHTVIQKRSGGTSEILGTASRVTAAAEDDSVKELEAVCDPSRGGRTVRLELWVDGTQAINPPADRDPLEPGLVGLQVVLPGGGGAIDDTLEVEFDDFEVFAD